MEKVALVTGGARGIGRAIAADFAQDHATAITYRSTPPHELQRERPGIHAIHADLSDADQAQGIVAEVIDRFGRLDVVINNAGALQPSPFDATEFSAHRSCFDVNVIAPMALLSAALPHLQPGACVISISSVNAVLPAMGAAAYSASKAALDTWTRGMAKELGPRGIRVNAVAPGAIERNEAPRPADLVAQFVEMTALGRVGTPKDIAPVVRFLASDAASFITGEVLTVSGGYRL